MIDLPERDCLVLYQDEVDRKKKQAPYWVQVRFDGADGEYDGETGHMVGHGDRHMIVYSDEELDLDHVTAWIELPTVPA